MQLKVDSITKIYGEKTVLKDFSLTCKEGIVGLLGPNGAGKTTFIKILCQLIPPTSGMIQIDGKKINKHTKKNIGVMFQQQELYEEFYVEEFLYYIATLKGLTKDKTSLEINSLLETVQLIGARKMKIKHLSGGMKQRLLIAQTLLGNPKILIFDEPTAGLDPNQRIKIRNLFSTLAQDHILIICTHVVQDIESIADKIIMLDKGEQIQSGSVEEILKNLQTHVYELETDAGNLDYYQKQGKVSNIYRNDENLRIRIISENKLENSMPVYPTLEDAYLWFIRDENN
ncbi:ABC transporter ATP-binding protein [Holdemania massiliensis]|uniref:ABC transporter ATP-binding protein n=1 Tax=Holdemania massiliensis TaxID=1468449 RepID=UPI001F06717D|nr:ABC transporter ATP-binding protein [Holdemania massiliensis]MCH1939511.1 ABC transporter ATP-binding protein [Holdemania massiliensis]